MDYNISPEAPIFPITERAAQKQLKLVCDYLGYTGISTHSFRKFYATEIYKNSHYNIALVQQLLQHSSAAVTQRYIGIQQQEIEEAIEGHLCLDVWKSLLNLSCHSKIFLLFLHDISQFRQYKLKKQSTPLILLFHMYIHI